MSRSKPLSKEEKRIRLKSIFNETKNVYLLKELERIAPKQKGIVAKTVEEVLKEIVDDGLVHSEKIGTSVYFWSFPSEELVTKRTAGEKSEKEIHELETEKALVEEENEKLKRERSGGDEREEKVKEYEYMQKRREDLQKELDMYRENDPQMIITLKKNVEKAKEAVNRWTDGVFTVQSYAKDKVQVTLDELNKGLGIPDDLDYIE